MAEGVVIDTTFWGTRQSGVAALERELTRLRRAQSAHARELGRPIARASVLNLIVYADREEHARRAARSIAVGPSWGGNPIRAITWLRTLSIGTICAAPSRTSVTTSG